MTRQYGITNIAPYASAPPVGLAGDMYWNTTSKTIFVCDSGAWIVGIATPTAPSFWFGGAITPSAVIGNDSHSVVGWATTRTAGFSLAVSGQRITPAVAGKYLVLPVLSMMAGTAAASFSRNEILHYNSSNVLQSNTSSVGPGTPANSYMSAAHSVILDMVVGDYIVIQVSVGSSTGQLNPSATFASVVSVGGGFKGDSGGGVWG